MYVCMYVYIYVCMYVFMYVCMYVYMYACMYACIMQSSSEISDEEVMISLMYKHFLFSFEILMKNMDLFV